MLTEERDLATDSVQNGVVEQPELKPVSKESNLCSTSSPGEEEDRDSEDSGKRPTRVSLDRGASNLLSVGGAPVPGRPKSAGERSTSADSGSAEARPSSAGSGKRDRPSSAGSGKRSWSGRLKSVFSRNGVGASGTDADVFGEEEGGGAGEIQARMKQVRLYV